MTLSERITARACDTTRPNFWGYRLSAPADIWLGVSDRFPLCCVLRFALTNFIHPGYKHAVKRGGACTARSNGVFVPCRIFHRTTEPWEPFR